MTSISKNSTSHAQGPPLRVHVHGAPRWSRPLDQAHQVRLPDHGPGLLREDGALGQHLGGVPLQARLHGGRVEHRARGAQEGFAKLRGGASQKPIKVPTQRPPQVLLNIPIKGTDESI